MVFNIHLTNKEILKQTNKNVKVEEKNDFSNFEIF